MRAALPLSLTMRGLITCFAVRIIGGLASYALPLTPRRERDIRTYCGELLGINADPARVTADTATVLEEYVEEIARSQRDEGTIGQRFRGIRELIALRSRIAQGHAPNKWKEGPTSCSNTWSTCTAGKTASGWT